MTTVRYFDPDLALEPCLNTCLNTCFPVRACVSSLGVSTPVLVSQHLNLAYLTPKSLKCLIVLKLKPPTALGTRQ